MKIRNYLLKVILSLIASLPFGLLYFVSDFMYFITYYVVRYRRKLVFANISNSFPEKNAVEVNHIVKKFYKNFCDVVVEVIKSMKMSPDELEKRVAFKNQEVFDNLYEKEKNVFASLGHCGNWEWVGNKIALFLKHEGAAIYKPIHDQFFNEYMLNQRQKYKNTLMIDYKKVFRSLIKLRDQLYTVFVLADQSPAIYEIDYFTTFLGRKTPFYNGMEKVARALDYAVIYLDVFRIKRGFYEVDVKLITDSAASTRPDEIMYKYVNYLQQTITRQPDNWLWSHNRWKFKGKE